MKSTYFVDKKKYIAKNTDELDDINKLDINDPINVYISMKLYGLFYNKKKLMIETANIILTKNTFIGGNFGVNILFDKNQSDLIKLYDHFKIIDDYFGSDNFKNNLFGSKKLFYESIIKEKNNQDDSDDSDDDNIAEKYFKCKFKVSKKQDKEIELLTHILTNGIFCKSTFTDNKSKYGGYNLHLNDEKYSCLTGNSKIKLIFYYDYVWANSHKYGISLKIDLIDINNENPKTYTNQYTNKKFELDLEPKITLCNKTIIEI
nr:hypothetical protein [Megavirus caiporensis]